MKDNANKDLLLILMRTGKIQHPINQRIIDPEQMIFKVPVKFSVEGIMKRFVLGVLQSRTNRAVKIFWISNYQVNLVKNYFHPITEPGWAFN